MRIAVLAGGISPERDVSLCSASLISNALLSKGHEVAFVDVYEGIEANDLDSCFVKYKIKFLEKEKKSRRDNRRDFFRHHDVEEMT